MTDEKLTKKEKTRLAKQAAEERSREAREEAKRLKDEEEAKLQEKRDAKRLEKERFFARDLSLEEIYRQACQRVYFMKSTRDRVVDPTSPAYDFPRRADNLLSKLKYAESQMRKYEKKAAEAQLAGNSEDVKANYERADEYIAKLLFSAYGIGQLFNNFKDEQ